MTIMSNTIAKTKKFIYWRQYELEILRNTRNQLKNKTKLY